MYLSFMNNSSLYKGILKPIIIQLLKETRRMYGFEITQTVKELTKGRLVITEGALYPLLHGMEAEGLLESKQEFVENRMRKYYSLTTRGKQVSKNSFNEVADFIMQLQHIFNLKTT